MTQVASNAHRVEIVVASSALQTLAASMSAGAWSQMSPTPSGLGLFTGQAGASGILTGYSTKMAYDPVGRRIYFIGQDHGDVVRFLRYDEVANAWTALTVPPWSVVGGTPRHGYEHNTWDTTNGMLYHMIAGITGIRRWNGTSWSASGESGMDHSGITTYAPLARDIEWFPELGRVVIGQIYNNPSTGKIFGYSPASSNWIQFGSDTTGWGQDAYVARYSPTHQCVVVGGGGGNLQRLSSAATITALASIPGALGTIGTSVGSSTLFCNPANGNYVAMRDSSTWYNLDPTGSGSWASRGDTCAVLQAPLYPGQTTWGIPVCTIFGYGVAVFIKAYSGGSPAQMWLWKGN